MCYVKEHFSEKPPQVDVTFSNIGNLCLQIFVFSKVHDYSSSRYFDVVESCQATSTLVHKPARPVDKCSVNDTVIQQPQILNIDIFKLPAKEMVSAIVNAVEPLNAGTTAGTVSARG